MSIEYSRSAAASTRAVPEIESGTFSAIPDECCLSPFFITFTTQVLRAALIKSDFGFVPRSGYGIQPRVAALRGYPGFELWKRLNPNGVASCVYNPFATPTHVGVAKNLISTLEPRVSKQTLGWGLPTPSALSNRNATGK